MTTLTVRKSVSLFCQEGSSDKEYHIYIEDSSRQPGGYDVRVTWGKRGNASSSQHKETCDTMRAAEAVLESIKRSKEAKGYKENLSLAVGRTIPPPSYTNSPTATEREYTELKPQLLNPISVNEMSSFIINDDYLAQEKLDGKRIMVEVNFGKVTASNRRSWKVGIPQDVEEELAKFDDCILDGELVGGVYYVFDCLGHNGDDIREQSYAERFNRLVETVIGNRMLYQVDIVTTAYDEKDKRALIESLKHKEGVVFKHLHASYSAGRPNSGGSQFKCKFWSSATFVVSKVNAKRSVAISVDAPDGFVPVGNVTVPPNYELPQEGDCVEVKYLYYHPGGALCQPQYLGVRDDVEFDVLASLKPKSEDTDE